MAASEQITPVPTHVPPELVIDFDFMDPPGDEAEVHLKWKRLHQGPDIFWTPRYGGHWVVTRAADIETIRLDHEHFSHREFALPRGTRPIKFLPIEADPPEHTLYRALINPAFAPTAVAALESQARELAIEIIERLRPQGECDFVRDFARQLPITIFLRMVDLPLEMRERFLDWADEIVRWRTKETKAAAFASVLAYMSTVIAERRKNPGSDIISQIIKAQVNGKVTSNEEVLGMCALLFVGGLDTVASMLSFFALFLARNPAERKRLIDEPAILPQAMEELLRRYAVSTGIRVVAADIQFRGVLFKEGDAVQIPGPLSATDERRYVDPLTVDFDRKDKIHFTFGVGPHFCPGARLARAELRVFLQEWLKRIPDFSIRSDAEIEQVAGSVVGVKSLPLVWPKP